MATRRIVYALVAACAAAALVFFLTSRGSDEDKKDPPKLAHVPQNPLLPLPPPTPEEARASMMKLGEGLRLMLEHTKTGDEQALVKASAAFADMDDHPMSMLVRSSYLYHAWCQEKLGDAGVKDDYIEKELFGDVHYDYFFTSVDLAQVLWYHLHRLCQQSRTNLEMALEKYAKSHGNAYPASLDALVPEYTQELPICSVTGPEGSRLRYTLLRDGRYALLCDHGAAPWLERDGHPAGQGPRITERQEHELEQKFKVYEMLLDGYTERARVEDMWPDFMAASGLKKGQTVADIGSGPGLFTIPFAKKVGASGKVVAIDINQSVLDFVAHLAKRTPGVNVETVRVTQKDLGVPDATLDLAFLVETYHAMLDIDRPADEANYEKRLRPWLATVLRALKPGGILVLADANVPGEVVRDHLTRSGFELVKTSGISERNRKDINVFRRPGG